MPMLATPQENAYLHSDFYKKQFHKILRLLMYSLFITFALVIAIIYFTIFRSPQVYYANTTDGLILTMPQGVPA